MMPTNDSRRIVTFFLSFFAGLMIFAVVLFSIFLAQNKLSWSEYWEKSDVYGSIPLPKLKFTKGIKTLHEEFTFAVSGKLNISVDIETVSFVEEDRDDILVVYDYRHPNTPEYQISFKAFATEDGIRIIASTQSNHSKDTKLPLSVIDDIYRGSVTIHLPRGHHFESVTIASSFANIDQAYLYENSDYYLLNSSMGNIDFTVNKPKKLISVDCDLGNTNITTNSKVDAFDVISSLGNCYLNFKQDVGTIYLLNDFGSNYVMLEQNLEGAIIQTNSGDIQFFLNRSIPASFSASTISGEILAYLPKNEVTSALTVEGKVDSYFEVNQAKHPDVILSSHAGNIMLKPVDEEGRRLFQDSRPSE